MALATFRNNDTGELLQLHEDWLTRFPNDPYTRIGTDELAKIEAEQRQADIAALGAEPYDAGDEAPAVAPEPAPTPVGKSTDGQDTPTPAPSGRDERRF